MNSIDRQKVVFIMRSDFYLMTLPRKKAPPAPLTLEEEEVKRQMITWPTPTLVILPSPLGGYGATLYAGRVKLGVGAGATREDAARRCYYSVGRGTR